MPTTVFASEMSPFGPDGPYALAIQSLCLRLIVAADRDGDIAELLRGRSRIVQNLIRQGVAWPKLSDEEADDLDDNAWRIRLADANPDLLDDPISFPRNTILSDNLDRLAGLVGLEDLDRDVVHLLALLKQHPLLTELSEATGRLTTRESVQILATLLGTPEALIEAMIGRRNGTLVKSVVRISPELAPLVRKIQMISGLSSALSMPCHEPIDFLGDRYQRVEPPTLQLVDFPQQAEDADLITRLLSQWRIHPATSCNILIYGPPGTGKTEFARLVASLSGNQLFADCPQEDSGRLENLAFAQQLLARSPDTLILVDEADDLVGTPLGRETGHGYDKYRLTQTIDEAKVPTIWITNHLYRFEPALIRRFAYVLEMKVPSRSVRERIFDQCLARFSPPADLRARCVDNDAMAPAILAATARTVAMIRSSDLASGDDTAFTARAVCRILENTTRALGIDYVAHLGRGCRTAFRPEALNADCNLDLLLTGLKAHPSARLCLFGPPGTGKTAFVHHMAERLDRPLVVRRASDLLSRWVGGTEENIADAFREARTEGAVLLFDEADSFLADRSTAERSYEVTQVNELLTQLEAFEGIFAAATNRIERLDTASLRRFDFKIGFRPLRPEQAALLLDDLMREMGMSIKALAVATGLVGLTPGDFANVRRQSRTMPPENAAALLDRLRQEVAARTTGPQAIGFVQ